MRGLRVTNLRVARAKAEVKERGSPVRRVRGADRRFPRSARRKIRSRRGHAARTFINMMHRTGRERRLRDVEI